MNVVGWQGIAARRFPEPGVRKHLGRRKRHACKTWWRSLVLSQAVREKRELSEREIAPKTVPRVVYCCSLLLFSTCSHDPMQRVNKTPKRSDLETRVTWRVSFGSGRDMCLNRDKEPCVDLEVFFFIFHSARNSSSHHWTTSSSFPSIKMSTSTSNDAILVQILAQLEALQLSQAALQSKVRLPRPSQTALLLFV